MVEDVEAGHCSFLFTLRGFVGQTGQLPASPDCVFDASLLAETCPNRFIDSRELINKYMESAHLGTGTYLSYLGSVNRELDFLTGSIRLNSARWTP